MKPDLLLGQLALLARAVVLLQCRDAHGHAQLRMRQLYENGSFQQHAIAVCEHGVIHPHNNRPM
eukprot:3351686-Prorocentrum_lima.AAC.1